LREELRGLLMQALYRGGRQADALAVYDTGRRMLRDELGLEPSLALRELQQRLLNQTEVVPPTEPESVVRVSEVGVTNSRW
jgi:DNA-binding SARP family transcriptional activator